MRTTRKTLVTFSGDLAVDISLPKGWSELSAKQLKLVYDLMEMYEGSDEDVRIHVLRHLIGLNVGRQDPVDGKYVCQVLAVKDDKLQSVVLKFTAEEMAVWVDELNWMASPGEVPVRLESLGGAAALNAQFHGVDFRTYYMAENLYQGYLATSNPMAVVKLERLLYPGIEIDEEPGLARTMNIINWLTQLKMMFHRKFPNFFKPSPSGSPEQPDMVEVMNCQIRALTGGDVTKEDLINNTDCWRALTELDFKAKEAEELRAQQAKFKK